MRAASRSTPTLSHALRVPVWVLLVVGLAGCARTAPQAGPSAPTITTAASAASSQAPAASAADAALAIAVARESATRAAREQTLRVQQHLRDQQRTREAAQRGDGSERCVAGQKMRRVANGWVQAGTC